MTQASDLDFINSSRILNLPTPLANGEAATKLYVDNALTSAFKYKGVINCSTNPNYPAALIGDVWKVSVAGLIGGGSGVAVRAGDTIYCTVNSAAGTQAAVGANFNIINENIDLATTTTAGMIQLATQVEVNAGANTIKAVVPSTLTTFYNSKAFAQTFGDGVNPLYGFLHNLGSTDVIVQVRELATNTVILPEILIQNANLVQVIVNPIPALNSLRVVIKS